MGLYERDCICSNCDVCYGLYCLSVRQFLILNSIFRGKQLCFSLFTIIGEVKKLKPANRINVLKQRKQHCCCKYCGGLLEIRRVAFSENDDARVELYCPQCRKIEFGVEREIYAAAEYFVEEMGFRCITDIDNSMLEKQINIAKVAEIISWGFLNLGYTDENGFCYPVNVTDVLLHESLNLKMSQWKILKEGLNHETAD